MGAIHVHEFITVDGVVDAPSWTFEYGFDPKMGEAIGAVTAAGDRASCSAGTPTRCSSRRGRRGPSRTTPARRSSTTRRSTSCPARSTNPTWRNSEVVGAYDAAAIRKLKDEADGDLYVSGSIQLVRAMIADGLVDGLHLFMYPLTLGGGLRLFPDGDAPAKLALAGTEAYPNGVVYLNYQPAA